LKFSGWNNINVVNICAKFQFNSLCAAEVIKIWN